MIFTPADASSRGFFAVLQRVDGKWTDASAYMPYCANLPTKIRQQLFLDKKTKSPRREIMAPRGETRC